MSTRSLFSGAPATRNAASSPYLRRPAPQPKSSRQQFSACGACRMRRVRCDLKDLPIPSSGPFPSCSNCKERGFNCVDEFAIVKAAKLLRRGRRLQQVEAIYGKAQDNGAAVIPSTTAERNSSQIPTLRLEFFSSPFWSWFCAQRPILDPNEFSQRYNAHIKKTHSLGREGEILAMVIMASAASLGVDASGIPVNNEGVLDELVPSLNSAASSRGSGVGVVSPTLSPVSTRDVDEPVDNARKRRREKTNTMLREILQLVDSHQIMRRPTWDGVCVLLLMLPLMEEAPYLEKTTVCEAAISQARVLCSPLTVSLGIEPTLPPFVSGQRDFCARICWSAHIQEGISTGMKGGHLILNDDDLDSFRRMFNTTTGDLNSNLGFGFGSSSIPRAPQVFLTLPFRLSTVCRKVHGVLTGLKAMRRAEEHNLIDVNGMREIWRELELCWNEFEAMKNRGMNILHFSSFVDAWLIFTFECHNIILQSLQQLTYATEPTDDSYNYSAGRASPNSSPYLPPQQLYLEARAICIRLLPEVLHIIQYHLNKGAESSDYLSPLVWDTGLVRDGCFFAGLLAVSLHGDVEYLEGYRRRSGVSPTPEEGVKICLEALSVMRSAFSRTIERSEIIRVAWNTREKRDENQTQKNLGSHGADIYNASSSYSDSIQRSHLPHRSYPESLSDARTSGSHSSTSTTPSPLTADSISGFIRNMDDSGAQAWPTYTPPTTGTTTSSGHNTNRSNSPTFHGLPEFVTYKQEAIEHIFAHVPDSLDQFDYAVTGSEVASSTLYHSRGSATDTHLLSSSTVGSSYANPIFTSPSPLLKQSGSDINDYVNDYYS